MLHYRHYSDKWYSNLIAWSIENPFKTWWKARKYFRFPDIRITISNNSYIYPYASSKWRGKILDIDIHDVMWKDKYNSPRHERNPLIYICLFSLISLWIVFPKSYINEFGEREDASYAYWEYMLQYLYYSKHLKCYSCWVSESKLYRYTEYGDAEDGSDDKFKLYKNVIPCVAISLNKRGISKLKKDKL